MEHPTIDSKNTFEVPFDFISSQTIKGYHPEIPIQPTLDPSYTSLPDISNHSLDGNGSITPLGLPYQMFVSLIGTCGMGSDPLCCEGFLPPSTKLVLEGGPTKSF